MLQLTNISILMLAGLVTVIIVPVVMIIERARARIYGAYMSVPFAIVRRLTKLSHKRLLALRVALGDDAAMLENSTEFDDVRVKFAVHVVVGAAMKGVPSPQFVHSAGRGRRQHRLEHV